jgi:hypothetical protein
MNKYWFYLGVVSSLSILTTSCGGDSQPPTPAASPAVTAPSPAAAVPPTAPTTPVATAATTPAPIATTPAPDKSKVAVKPVSVDVAAGLIPPTDGESWAKTVSKGRSDPFGMLSLQPVEVIEPIDPLAQPVTAKIATNNSLPTTKSGVAKLSPLPTIKVVKVSGKQRIASNGNRVTTSKQSTTTISAIPRTGINRALPKITVAISASKPVKSATIVGPRNNKGTATIKPVKTAMIPKSRSNNNGISAIKPVQVPSIVAAKPEKIVEKPLQAMALEISGVIEVDGQTQIIIKMPTESFSRYIAVGERIGNGKVLIKRVEGQNSLTPTVVLEEVGVEVPRKIGDVPSASTESVATPPQKTP